MPISRREFVRSAAAGLAAIGLRPEGLAAAPVEEPMRAPSRPVVISSANGETACARAFELLDQGADPVDAVVAGVNRVEDDPNDHSVGYGGLPNEDGVVELDACVMHGPRHKAGAVAALQRIRNPSSVAKVVMDRTDHVLLVGEGALRFARAHGFKEEDLLTDEARQIWLKWKESHSAEDDWLYPEAGEEAARRGASGGAGLARPPLKDRGIEFTYGTITCMALTASVDIGGCTSTSGLSYKLPGRVGDSPILGAGLYVDNAVGACGSTGRGEANLLNCSSFLVVELMRGGATPEEACRQVAQRIADRTEKRLRESNGQPNYALTFYALRKDGLVGGYGLHSGGQLTVHDRSGGRKIALPGLYAARPPADK